VAQPRTPRPSVDVVVPAWNEAARIEATLEALGAFAASGAASGASSASADRRPTIFLADDGSTDRTAEVAAAAARAAGLALEHLPMPHRGKALTVRDAMLAVSGRSDAEYLLMLDADNEISIDNLERVPWTGDPRTVYIARRVGEADGRVAGTASPFRRLMSFAMRVGARVLLGLPYRDTQCGFKLFPRSLAFELFSQQRSASWVFDAEILVIARRSRLPIVEVPVIWQPRGESRVRATAAITSAIGLVGIAARRWARRYRRVGSPRRP
jgi:dolichyl-phosphate beta-glucosyltransferase